MASKTKGFTIPFNTEIPAKLEYFVKFTISLEVKHGK